MAASRTRSLVVGAALAAASATLCLVLHGVMVKSRRRRRAPKRVPPVASGKLRVVVLGCGTSEGVPRLSCLTRGDCRICEDAHYCPGSKNRRRNTGLLLLLPRPVQDGDEGEPRAVMIDCGKFWWHAALDAFPAHGVSRLDAIVITHSHNDAAYGLDDLRDLTRSGDGQSSSPPLPIFIRDRDYPVIHGAFPYLVGQKDLVLAAGGGVPQVQFHRVAGPSPQQGEEEAPMKLQPVPGLEMLTLPLVYGGANGCWGFRVGPLVYISDAVGIPERTRDVMHGCQVLILDGLRWGPHHPSHFTIEQACREVEKLRPPLPSVVYLVGMNHEVDYHDANAFLAKRLPGTRARLAYDGLAFDLDYQKKGVVSDCVMMGCPVSQNG